jgi:hypothetical protein
MRFFEFTIPQILDEGGKSDATKYITEIGMLAGLCGMANPESFDPDQAEMFFDPSMLGGSDNAKKVTSTIKSLLQPIFSKDPQGSLTRFNMWYQKGVEARSVIEARMSELDETISGFTYTGKGNNKNPDGPADVEFLGTKLVQGVSVKDEGAPTLANLPVSAVGLEQEKGVDIFQKYCPEEFAQMKRNIFSDVLADAMQNPGQQMSWHKESKYWIMYQPAEDKEQAEIPQPINPEKSDELNSIKKNAGLSVPELETEPNPEQELAQIPPPEEEEESKPITESAHTHGDIFICQGKGKTFKGTYEQVMSACINNKPWQRVFGDWFQANWSTKKAYAEPLFVKIAEQFRTIITSHLEQDRKLDALLKMGKRSYFYANFKNLYYVPSISEVDDLKVKDIKYGNQEGEGADGTGQKFYTVIGRPDSEQNASISIYIRYANGMFACNPTTRVQNLQNAEFLGWEILA